MLYALNKNTTTTSILQAALNDLEVIIGFRIQSHFNGKYVDLRNWIAENLGKDFLSKRILNCLPQVEAVEEWIILMLALAPHLRSDFFETIIARHLPDGGNFPEFGGVKGSNHRGLLPTGETARFIIGGSDMHERLAVHSYFGEAHFFNRLGILWLEPVKEGEPEMSGRMILDNEWVDKILFGKASAPRFGLDFPAHKITTAMNWDDAVLHPQTAAQIDDIKTWLRYNNKIFEDNNLKRKVKPGYRVLFYGQSGTGKTMTASLLGKDIRRDVYRIDLSQIVSKYIGETEKNLESVFKKAESKSWILFFDEADALFGKRTQVQSSHDRYANQEVSYLLQRIEDYPGLLILASNFKNNLDDAFVRRFHAIIHFPVPQPAERLLLWQKAMASSLSLSGDVNLSMLAHQYELTGAGILNAMHFAALSCFAKGVSVISNTDILGGIRKELIKEEKNL